MSNPIQSWSKLLNWQTLVGILVRALACTAGGALIKHGYDQAQVATWMQSGGELLAALVTIGAVCVWSWFQKSGLISKTLSALNQMAPPGTSPITQARIDAFRQSITAQASSPPSPQPLSTDLPKPFVSEWAKKTAPILALFLILPFVLGGCAQSPLERWHQAGDSYIAAVDAVVTLHDAGVIDAKTYQQVQIAGLAAKQALDAMALNLWQTGQIDDTVASLMGIDITQPKNAPSDFETAFSAFSNALNVILAAEAKAQANPTTTPKQGAFYGPGNSYRGHCGGRAAYLVVGHDDRRRPGQCDDDRCADRGAVGSDQHGGGQARRLAA